MVERLSEPDPGWVAVDDHIARHLLGDDAALSATAVQTVGAKKWDGFVLAVVGDVR